MPLGRLLFVRSERERSAVGAPARTRKRHSRANFQSVSLRMESNKPRPPSKPGTVQSGRSARRAVEPLGEFANQAFGPADVAEEERVLEVDDLPARSPAAPSAPSADPSHSAPL